MDKKDPPKNKDYESDTSSVGSDDSFENTGGPNFADFAKRLAYDKTDGYGDNQYYSPYEAGDKPTENKEGGDYVFPSTITTKVEPPKTTDITTLFLIDSMNRDRNAFPQPTSFTLRLPRVYKNVKSVSMTQVKLLCSFYYFSPAKSNIYLPVIERGRESITSFNNYPITKVVTIRQGTYGINDLLNEVQRQLNYTPLFYDFPNGFTDFIKLFTVNGDFSINFNQPGDSYFDSLNSKYIQNPTMATIVSYYWGNRYAGLMSYTIDQLKVAYYYPVIYEIFLDAVDLTAKSKLNLNVPPSLLTNNETVYSHLIFNMSGINDQVALYLINQNINFLDTYRLNHTFRFSLVNRYQVSYDSQSLNVNIVTTTLNTSLVNLINNTSASALTSILNNFNLNTTSFATLQANVNKATVVYMDMFQFLQTTLATFAGIPYATYASQFFNNLNNILYIQNGQQASGVRTGYTLEYLLSGSVPITSTLTTYTNSPGYWPNIKASNGYIGTNFSTINSPYSIIPYNVSAKNFQFGTLAIDSSNYYLNTNKSTRSVDVLANILPGKYTIFKFRSPSRQTLQVETLPLPYYYRYANYNKNGLYTNVLDLNGSNVPQQYFDISYNFVDNAVPLMDVTNYSTSVTVLRPRFGNLFQSSFTSISSFTLNSQKNYSYFEFISPYPSSFVTGLYAYNTNLSFVSMQGNISTLFPDKFSMFVYHDRGAYMADLGKLRSENPVHYIQSNSTDTTKSDMTVHFSTFSGHKYYTIIRSDNVSCPNTSIRPVVYYNDSNYVPIITDYVNFDPNADPYNSSNLTNYPFVTNYNTDFTRLPVASTLQGFNPESSTFNLVLPLKGPPLGYDISGVSNDLTDYVGFDSDLPGVNPTSQIRIDPLNYYSFNFLSPYDGLNQTYFNITTSNAIITPFTGNLYNLKGVSTSQYKIVHWYDGYSMPQQIEDQITTKQTIGIAQTSSISQYITSYPVDSSNNPLFGRGINAIGFLPTDGVYAVSSFAFKSSIYPLSTTQVTSEDPNSKIKYVGVFSGTTLVSNNITLSAAIAVLKFDKAVPYAPKTLNNTPGFGTELGTWYNYIIDPEFNTSNTISGYTASGTELLNYNSMYYMVPFNYEGVNMNYSYLSGSLVPYPLAQKPSTVTSFFGQTATNAPGSAQQSQYIIPQIIPGANPAYGPQGSYSQIQSQYQQSIPITTASIGYKNHPVLVNNTNAPFSFSTIYTNPQNQYLSSIALTTYFSEYDDNLFTVNASSIACSNSQLNRTASLYASSLSTAISLNGGDPDSIKYLTSQPSTLQNYPIQGTVYNFSTFTFKQQSGDNANITVQSFQVLPTMSNFTMWLWGGGGGTWSNTSSISGGAGAYAKVSIDVPSLLSTTTLDSPGGVSTLYIVVGKGGNRDDFSINRTVGSLQQYEQARYGGGGTSLLGNFVNSNSISLQGGGFTGIFTNSNLFNATPLLVVGGGGAAGASNLGGPGGFGLTSEPLPITQLYFDTVLFNGINYNKEPILTITDVFNNTVANNSNVNNSIDSNYFSYWEPINPSVMNPLNYYSTPNTYGVIVQLNNNVAISKIKYGGPPEFNTSNLPTGIVVYNDLNKTQVLYSNTSIGPTDFQVVDNGSFRQQVYEIITTEELPTTINSNAYLIAGSNSSPQNSIQYSLDGITWVPTENTYSNITSIHYIPFYNRWYATSSTILYSIDGINWLPTSLTNFNGSIFNALAFNLDLIVAGGDDGSIFYSLDGDIWNQVPSVVFTNYVNKIRFLNGKFWAIGGNNFSLQTSSDGINWAPVLNVSLPGMNDITYSAAISRYVISQPSTLAPFNSPLIYSNNGVTWFPSGSLNIITFTGQSVTYGAGVFVAVGKTTDSTSFIKYSTDGINWLNSRFPVSGNFQRNSVEFLNNRFVSVGKPSLVSGRATNQVSVVTSRDGINWSYSLSGGFNLLGSGNSSSYGPITILPNLTSIYIEFIKTSSSNLRIYELSLYDNPLPISVIPDITINTSNNTNIFYPSDNDTSEVYNYPFIFTFDTVAPAINNISVYLPEFSTSQFTGVTVSLDSTSNSTIYSDLNISSIKYDSDSGQNLYNIAFIPSLSSIKSLYFNFIKNTVSSLQLTQINGINDPNKEPKQIPGYIVSDLDTRNTIGTNVQNIIDNSLTSFWLPTSFNPGNTLKLQFSFSTIVDRINHIQVFNGPYSSASSNLITGIGVYTDSNYSVQLYSNASVTFKSILGYSMFEFDIVPLVGYSNIYIEMAKTTPGLPLINEVRFFNIGLITLTSSGYSGGTTVSMTRYGDAFSQYDGGGGSNIATANSGLYAIPGKYLTGGSPAVLHSQLNLSTTLSVSRGSGGGGGGYYGGGGGGAISNNAGGAGGGGSGYIYQSPGIISLIDYGVAIPGSNTTVTNYIPPGINEQSNLAFSNILTYSTIGYGAGGRPSYQSGKGEHGLLILAYDITKEITPPSTTATYPSFIDGSQLSLFQSPIIENSDSRVISFTTYRDPILSSQYASNNWVWYNSYLSLVGGSLTDSMNASITIPVKPGINWPNLPDSIFTTISSQFSNVNQLFTIGTSQDLITSITSTLTGAFSNFQNNTFINTSHSSASYYEMTEIYCLLDYLRNSDNLTNPHVNPLNPRLDRIFGGIPRFGYWANPFLVNASYIGFDVTSSQIPLNNLSTIAHNGNQVQAMYGLVLEQSLNTGIYTFTDIMAYKPNEKDVALNGSNWLKVTQFPDSYVVRSLTNATYTSSNVPVQPYTFRNAISARLPLFNYSVYTIPSLINNTIYNIPVQILNDFEGQSILMYSFQNTDLTDITSIHINSIPLTSTIIKMNQTNISQQPYTTLSIIGTMVSEYQSTIVNSITSFGFNGKIYQPQIKYTTGINNYYNTYDPASPITNPFVGKAINDFYGNFYVSEKNANILYQNICSLKIYQQPFSNASAVFASPQTILGQYNANISNPYSDIFVSKYTNIWHFPLTAISSIHGVRLTSPYDFNVKMNFVNQIFYPTHKIVLNKTKSFVNPIENKTDVLTYPSYQHTEMFFYKNFSSMVRDISGQFANENKSNFSYQDSFSGYGFNSYIYNINLTASTNFNNDNADSFNYLAVRAYSPSETFQSLVRFYLPQRYDFGYISLLDLSNERLIVNTSSNVNPDYKSFLNTLNGVFSTTQIYGETGVTGFSGSNISTVSFGDFLNKFNTINSINSSNSATLSSIIGLSNLAIANLITGDLQYILPSYFATRNRTTDPLEYNIPFSSCVTPSNALIEQYGLGYNLGFSLADTGFNTFQKAGSFFKIFDDSIFLRLNEEFGMNKMDISQPENFAQTLQTTAQSGLYNSKLILNSFGSFATTFVQSPVSFNPPIGKLDKLSFSWYDYTGVILNNADCEWSGSVQIVESVTASA